MTDLMKLAEAYAWHSVHGAGTTGESVICARDALQEVIEALQAENERLKAAYVEELDKLSTRNYELRKESDALKSKLDAMGKGEPVHIMPKGASAAPQLRAMATNYPAGHLWDKLDAQACIRGALEIEALRAAPKALAPLTDERKYKLLDHGDEIQKGDTVLDDDATTWHPLAGWEVGMKWGGNLMPMRRAIESLKEPTP